MVRIQLLLLLMVLALFTTPFSGVNLPASTAHALPTYVTTITVNTTADNTNFSMSETCTSASAGGVCTLRRAIVQARALPAAQRPALIAFNIPASQAHNPMSPDYWNVQIAEGVSSGLRDLAGGQITIDGSTQPGGRSSGPKIMLVGSTQADRLVLNGNAHIIRYVGVQYLRILLNASDNLIENSWIGLEASGADTFKVNGDPAIDSRASLEEAESSLRNIYRNNVISGSRTNAITVRGDQALIENNLIGTRADGTIPTVDPQRKCRPNAHYNNWFGGAGIVVSGQTNTVRGNRFVGLLFASKDPINTPPSAIELDDGDNIIEGNFIGIDIHGAKVGVCGDGIRLTNRNNVILNNTIYGAGINNNDPNKAANSENPQTGAIGLSGSGIALGNNLIRGTKVDSSVSVVFFYPSVSEKYIYFNPAKVTSISGRTISGTSGDPGQPPGGKPPVNSTCPNCVIELFLDDIDADDEALVSLGTVTANSSGNWVATDILPSGGLPAGQAIRTMSTTAASGTIIDFPAGTTTRISRDMYGTSGIIAPPPRPAAGPPTIPLAYARPAVRAVPALPEPDYKTTLVVNSSSDPDTSQSTTCSAAAAAGVCTLRRAVVEARNLAANLRPVLISFNIPTSDTGYNAGLGSWLITLNNATTNQLRNLAGGQITIDGTTQPGGRSNGPKIFVRGRNTQHILIVDSSDNIITGLGLQGFGIQVNKGANFIERNWLGLTEDGQSIYYTGGDQTIDNKASIQDAETAPAEIGGNVYRNNIIVGSTATAMSIRSDSSWIVGNRIGMRPDGTIPVPADQICGTGWVAGGGVIIYGHGNQIGGPVANERNYIVGIGIPSPNPTTTQPSALQLEGGDHLVLNNMIGRDPAGNTIGVCGEGIRVSGDFMLIQNNVIVAPHTSAMNMLPGVIGGSSNTFRSNLILASAGPITFGPIVPETYTYFTPAKITSIKGSTVSGISGDPGQPSGGKPPVNSSCPFCTVEVFLDNNNSLVETLESFGSTRADVHGNWVLTLPRELQAGEGLRTLSTTNNYGTIMDYEAGTSTRISSTRYTVAETQPTPTPIPTLVPVPTATPKPTPASYETYLPLTGR